MEGRAGLASPLDHGSHHSTPFGRRIWGARTRPGGSAQFPATAVSVLVGDGRSRCAGRMRWCPRICWPVPAPVMNSSFFWADPPEPARRNEVVWLEPYPDVLLGEIADSGPGAEARYAASEAISLAFIIALQLLPPRQRAVLILRDVLGFRASEVAQILETNTESVTTALKRARATLNRRLPPGGQEPPPAPDSAAARAPAQRLTRAFAA